MEGGRGAEIFRSTILICWATLSLIHSGIQVELHGPQPYKYSLKVWLRVPTSPSLEWGVPVHLISGHVEPPAGRNTTTAWPPPPLPAREPPFGQRSRCCSECSAPWLLEGPEGILHHLHSPYQGDGGRGGMSHSTPMPNWKGIPKCLHPIWNPSGFQSEEQSKFMKFIELS